MTSKECSTENKEVSGKEPDRVVRKLFRQTLVGIAILVLGVVFLARVFPEPVLAISQNSSRLRECSESGSEFFSLILFTFLFHRMCF
ncbi:hypothetical protein LEP1GSC123_0828 [Leptospira borgpetersenii str. 200701203]|uniref:Uncharacterized protein n=1 Tax=Leptospira borgpetersenii str. 200701203 TaxID=1193007 RepID=M3HX66_LEPBO|nr:hypothetical protein LEP1GSC123_0828 [Leptospira borgpetersenii str. 200701203]